MSYAMACQGLKTTTYDISSASELGIAIATDYASLPRYQL
jgi:hypothetical protein